MTFSWLMLIVALPRTLGQHIYCNTAPNCSACVELEGCSWCQKINFYLTPKCAESWEACAVDKDLYCFTAACKNVQLTWGWALPLLGLVVVIVQTCRKLRAGKSKIPTASPAEPLLTDNLPVVSPVDAPSAAPPGTPPTCRQKVMAWGSILGFVGGRAFALYSVLVTHAPFPFVASSGMQRGDISILVILTVVELIVLLVYYQAHKYFPGSPATAVITLSRGVVMDAEYSEPFFTMKEKFLVFVLALNPIAQSLLTFTVVFCDNADTTWFSKALAAISFLLGLKAVSVQIIIFYLFYLEFILFIISTCGSSSRSSSNDNSSPGCMESCVITKKGSCNYMLWQRLWESM